MDTNREKAVEVEPGWVVIGTCSDSLYELYRKVFVGGLSWDTDKGESILILRACSN